MKKVNFAPRHFDAEMLFRVAFGRGANYTVFIFLGVLKMRKGMKGKNISDNGLKLLQNMERKINFIQCF